MTHLLKEYLMDLDSDRVFDSNSISLGFTVGIILVCPKNCLVWPRDKDFHK